MYNISVYIGLIWVTWGVIRVIWLFSLRADMGFGYFKSDVILTRARRSRLYHTCKKNVFSGKYMIRCDIHHRIPILNTCHISHYETNSNRIWAFCKSIPIRFSNLTEISDHLISWHILWRNIHKSHFIVFITSFLHLNKCFLLFCGSSKAIFVKISQNFIKSQLKICPISQI